MIKAIRKQNGFILICLDAANLRQGI